MSELERNPVQRGVSNTLWATASPRSCRWQSVEFSLTRHSEWTCERRAKVRESVGGRIPRLNGMWAVGKMIPTSNGRVTRSRIANTTHSKAIKQVQGQEGLWRVGVFVRMSESGKETLKPRSARWRGRNKVFYLLLWMKVQKPSPKLKIKQWDYFSTSQRLCSHRACYVIDMFPSRSSWGFSCRGIYIDWGARSEKVMGQEVGDLGQNWGQDMKSGLENTPIVCKMGLRLSLDPSQCVPVCVCVCIYHFL